MADSGALFIGLMSGTSLDGVDAVLAAFDDAGRPRVIDAAHAPFPSALRQELLDLQIAGPDELRRAALAANALADLYAALALDVCRTAGRTAEAITAIGVHGQTIRHRPDLGYTLQLNAPARVAERSGMTVVADFRSRDVAAGGQGAPLVPAFHAQVFRRPGSHRVILNLGGMSNVTDLPVDPAAPVRGWDCGPGNVLLDLWITRHRAAAYDADGAWAASGRVDPGLLARLRAEPWFALPPPKSTGRDLFDAAWLDAALDGSTIDAADVQATLAELTAVTVADTVTTHAGRPDEVVVCGGGARNGDLLARLAARFGLGTTVTPCAPETTGFAPDHVEALAFAWLARQCLAGLPGNLPEVTGAAGPRILGAIFPR